MNFDSHIVCASEHSFDVEVCFTVPVSISNPELAIRHRVYSWLASFLPLSSAKYVRLLLKQVASHALELLLMFSRSASFVIVDAPFPKPSTFQTRLRASAPGVDGVISDGSLSWLPTKQSTTLHGCVW